MSLIQFQHGNTPLHEAAWRGYSRLVKVLSGLKTVNRQNNGGFTSLHLSCQAGHNQSTRELLIAGADPNLVNTYGDTPLHTAVRYGHAGVARILLSARAAPDVQNKVISYSQSKTSLNLIISWTRTTYIFHLQSVLVVEIHD